ncbi:MAG: FAD-dependent oxidoreductase [bacterium]|nr:FAD-dependent oxidoreductase [bacterium]
MSEEKVTCIIVGAGVAGSAAAITLAKAGIEVLVLERGEVPGCKNLFGGVLYTTILDKLVPDWMESAPLERYVTRKRFSIMGKDGEIALDFKTKRYESHPKRNFSFTVLRAKFDAWLAEQAEKAGAQVFPGMMVSELIIKNNRVVGVKTEPGGDELYADVVISAEGVHSYLTLQAGLRKSEFDPDHMVTAAKEVIQLDENVLADRFQLEGNEGVAFAYFGDGLFGMFGAGFIYTNKNTLSIGTGVTIGEMIRNKKNPNEILEHFKNHPAIRPYIRGGETIEYSAHMIPEYGYNHLPKLYMDGFLVTGDAAGLVNSSHHQEGTNLAMASGVFAAETVIEAVKRNDFTSNTLKLYLEKLENSFVLKDLKKYRHMTSFFNENPHFLRDYPDLMMELFGDYFELSEKPKEEIEKEIYKKLKRRIPLWTMATDAWKVKKALF